MALFRIAEGAVVEGWLLATPAWQALLGTLDVNPGTG
jgi:hypothetical protein